MGSTIDNVKNLADWFATESQSDDAGHSADVSQKSNTEIESVLSLGDISLTTTDEYLWYDGSRVKDDDENYLIFRVSKKTSSYRKDIWQSESEKKQVQAFENLVDGINNWYSFDSDDYFKSSGYILDSFKVGNVLPFGVAYLSCEYEKVSGIRDNYYTYIPMSNYPHFIKNNNSYNLNNSWGFTNISKGCVVQWAYINNDTHFGVVYRNKLKDTTSSTYYDSTVTYNVYLIEKTNQVMNWLGKNYHTEKGFIAHSDIYGDGGVAQGLTGIFKMASDKITKPTKPSVGVSSSGFVNVYKIDPQSLVDLGKDLFSDVDIDFDECVMTSEEFTNFINTSLTLSGVTLASVPQEMIEQGCGQEVTVGMSLASIFKLLKASVRNFFSSQLIKYVIDCHIIPCSPTHGNDERINIGYRQFSQVGKKLNEDYVDVSCGTLDLKGYYQNFLDAQTKLSLFLPFVGFVELSPQQFLMDGATIGVDYRFNVLDGSCIAYVSSNKIGGDTSIIGVYSGSCCVHLPITGENYSSMVSGMMQTIGGVASGIATGNPMLAGGSIVGGVSNMLSNMSGTQLGNNNFSCSASFMGIRKPYIVIERPVAQLPPRFFKDKGGLAQIVDKLSKFNGFTKCTDVQMPNDMPKSISDNIKSLLESGVIL